MASHFIIAVAVLLTHNLLLNCASAAVHSHSIDTVERESDGSYRARDYDHYNEGRHNAEFDHEAILGVVFIKLVSLTTTLKPVYILQCYTFYSLIRRR